MLNRKKLVKKIHISFLFLTQFNQHFGQQKILEWSKCEVSYLVEFVIKFPSDCHLKLKI